MPFKDFVDKKVEIYLYDFTYDEKTVFEYLIETLGGSVDLSQNTTHLMCKKHIDSNNLEKFKQKSNKNLILVNDDWLFDCLFEGKLVNEDKYSEEIMENVNTKS